jgi:hypothetical protein
VDVGKKFDPEPAIEEVIAQLEYREEYDYSESAHEQER